MFPTQQADILARECLAVLEVLLKCTEEYLSFNLESFVAGKWIIYATEIDGDYEDLISLLNAAKMSMLG